MKMLNRNSSIISVFCILLLAIWGLGCKKLIEVTTPITKTTGSSVYTADASAAAVLTGLYANMSKGSFATGGSSISLRSGLSADEYKLSGTVSNTDELFYYYTNTLFTNPTGSPGADWSFFYGYTGIYTCNSAIEELSKSVTLTPEIKQQLMGEAKFMRAFMYFYLVNLYGDVPLAITSDYEVNSHLARASASDVYLQIIKDLVDANNLLADHYVAADAKTTTSARVRPTKWAAAALLARTYLYTGDYVNAEIQATAVIHNSSLFNLVQLNDVFLANSMEAIWQLQPVNSGWNTEDSRVFIINEPPSTSKPISLSDSLYNSFASSDNRKVNWVKDTTMNGEFMPYPYKYKNAIYDDPVTEYLMVLRLAELYLIRAEARAQQNKISEAKEDLNTIRNRAGLDNTAADDKASLLVAILQERRVELFSEWGHRWLDLKRTNNIDAVMTIACVQKGGTWSSYKQLYPILYLEIQKNKNLTQNIGY